MGKINGLTGWMWSCSLFITYNQDPKTSLEISWAAVRS